MWNDSNDWVLRFLMDMVFPPFVAVLILRAKDLFSWIWWLMPLIPAVVRLMQ